MEPYKKYKYLFLLNIKYLYSVYFIKMLSGIQNFSDEDIFIYKQVKTDITRIILTILTTLQQYHQEGILKWHR